MMGLKDHLEKPSVPGIILKKKGGLREKGSHLELEIPK
jgi:hypothetical protein